MKTSHRMPRNSGFVFARTLLLVQLIVALGGLFTASASAQVLPSSEPTVVDVDIVFKGAGNVSEEATLAHVRIRKGMVYSQPLVSESIRSLYQTGNFEFVEVLRNTLDDGNIKLSFVVVPKFRISAILFDGNDSISDRKLKKEIELEVGLPLDEALVKGEETKLIEYYQKKGYSNAQISYSINRDEKLGTGQVIFNIQEDQRYKIDRIKFVGNESIKSGKLRDQMQTKEYTFLWSWLAGGGRKLEEQFYEDLNALRDFYKDSGYLDVEIPQSGVVFEYPKKGWLNIVINISEGRQYLVGDIRLEGNTLFSEEEIRTVFELNTGDTFVPSKVNGTVGAIKDFYGSVGYLDTFIRVERSPNLSNGVIDLKFIVSESERFFVESINLQGNTKTKSEVIVRELALAPGDTFDLVRMKSSQARLENTGFFEDVNLSPEATNIPGRRNLRITVKEGRTGNLSFGAGFSTVEQIVAFAEVSQSNFDLFNYKSRFTGAGQKFRFRFSVGTNSNSVLLSFEEPWVFQRRLAFGFELFHTESEFNSSEYDELRTGFEIYFRKRLFELVDGRLSYRLENVNIDNVASTADPVIQAEAGSRIVSKVGFTMRRDTRNRFLFPTSGTRLRSITELAGGPFLGDTDYFRQEFRGTRWFKTFDTLEQTFSINGRVGSVIPYDGNTVPFFDRYFLGGPHTLRGFPFREVGPKDPSGEPIGGNSMLLANLEYTFKLAEPLRFAVFYDWGVVNSDDLNFSLGDYNDNWGFGLRVMLLGAPLNLDFGFPITKDEFSDGGLEFSFSFRTNN